MAAAGPAAGARKMSPDDAMAAVRELFAEQGDADYIGEAVTQEEHALQCAELAKSAGAEGAVIAGAMLHDIGHMIGLKEGSSDRMDDCGIVNHEGIGRNFCDRAGFPATVGRVVEGHVQAKRYLCWKNPEYMAKLSDASKTTLRHQGGPMEDAEAGVFEKSDLFETIIRMRTWDEAAKIKGKVVPTLADWEPMLRGLLTEAA